MSDCCSHLTVLTGTCPGVRVGLRTCASFVFDFGDQRLHIQQLRGTEGALYQSRSYVHNAEKNVFSMVCPIVWNGLLLLL